MLLWLLYCCNLSKVVYLHSFQLANSPQAPHSVPDWLSRSMRGFLTIWQPRGLQPSSNSSGLWEQHHRAESADREKKSSMSSWWSWETCDHVEESSSVFAPTFLHLPSCEGSSEGRAFPLRDTEWGFNSAGRRRWNLQSDHTE